MLAPWAQWIVNKRMKPILYLLAWLVGWVYIMMRMIEAVPKAIDDISVDMREIRLAKTTQERNGN